MLIYILHGSGTCFFLSGSTIIYMLTHVILYLSSVLDVAIQYSRLKKCMVCMKYLPILSISSNMYSDHNTIITYFMKMMYNCTLYKYIYGIICTFREGRRCKLCPNIGDVNYVLHCKPMLNL